MGQFVVENSSAIMPGLQARFNPPFCCERREEQGEAAAGEEAEADNATGEGVVATAGEEEDRGSGEDGGESDMDRVDVMGTPTPPQLG